MAEVYYTKDIIRKMLSPFSISNEQYTGKFAVFVNKSIFQKFLKILDLDYQPMSWDYKLQIGNRFFEMKIIFLTMRWYTFVCNLIEMSQFSMPWLDRLTLFSDLASYHKLEKFIVHHGLRQRIVSTIDEEGPTLNGGIIRVVTFSDQADKYELITKYNDENQSQVQRQIDCLFITSAFPWLQSQNLKQVKIHWNDNQLLFAILPQILNHLMSISYSDELTIFDLISLKLAISDFPTVPNSMSCEIDYFITRTIRQMVLNQTYIKDKQFDLIQYSFDRNFVPKALITKCFLYEFQNYVESVLADQSIIFCLSDLKSTLPICKTIMLNEQSDAAQLLDTKSNIQFSVDGKNFDQMTFRLFSDLMTYDNVTDIILDTNYRWINKVPPLITNKSVNSSCINLQFIGDNVCDFIEDFVSSLKTMSYPKEKLNLIITRQCLSSFIVFDKFTCNTLDVRGTFINTQILFDLTQCNLMHINRVRFFSCVWENKVENWELYNNLKQFQVLYLLEDEWTWQYLFEFIVKRLTNSKQDEFKFSRDVGIIIFNKILIGLNKLRFCFDEFKTKLEILDENQQIVDLYDFKNFVRQDDPKSNFEFYQ